jgi:hypothetical protein
MQIMQRQHPRRRMTSTADSSRIGSRNGSYYIAQDHGNQDLELAEALFPCFAAGLMRQMMPLRQAVSTLRLCRIVVELPRGDVHSIISKVLSYVHSGGDHP